MQKIKVSELFYSLQGEGRFTGTPSVFLRTFGCNFTCDGFGMKSGEKSNERNNVASNIDFYKHYNDLPLVSTGCDSYASWDPRFKHLSPVVTVDEIAKQITNILPEGKWRDEHLVITGGEPLLGWQKAYPELLQHPAMSGLKHVTFETNGTQKLSEDMEKYIWRDDKKEFTFSCSVKLSVSGESREDALKQEVLLNLQDYGHTYLKYVCETEQDVEEAIATTKLFRYFGFNGDVYLMPLGGVHDMYVSNRNKIAQLCLQHGLKYSDRLHVELFGNQWGT